MGQTFISTNYSPDEFREFVRLALHEELPQVINSLQKTSSAPTYLSRTETAKRLRVSKTTLTQKVKAGEITAHRFGERRILFKEEDVNASLTQIEVRAKGGAVVK